MWCAGGVPLGGRHHHCGKCPWPAPHTTQSIGPQVYREALALFARADRASRHSEWPALRADLAELAGAATTAQRARVHERMTRAYKVFAR